MMKKFIFVRASKAWINPMHVVSIFRDGADWTISLVNGKSYKISDEEYLDILPLLGEEK